ncbi:MAG: chromate transporter [Clostridia bacterium]|nr:chromate transporter [Clostridia bacterium]
MKKALNLFFTMLKIGLFTFGGGYAMLALLENEFVSKRGWMEKDEFLDMVAIAESTPGPIAINCATYIGYKKSGVSGSVFATVGICVPSFIIIYIISVFLDGFLNYPVVEKAFRGVQVCVVYLIISAGIKMLKGLKRSLFNIVIVSATVMVMLACSFLSRDFSTVLFILLCGAVGIVYQLIARLHGEGRK